MWSTLFRAFSDSIRAASLALGSMGAPRGRTVRGNEELYGTTGQATSRPAQASAPNVGVTRKRHRRGSGGAAAVSDSATYGFCCTLRDACVLCHYTVLARMSRSVASLVRGNVENAHSSIAKRAAKSKERLISASTLIIMQVRAS